jgi:hypothetical protein
MRPSPYRCGRNITKTLGKQPLCWTYLDACGRPDGDPYGNRNDRPNIRFVRLFHFKCKADTRIDTPKIIPLNSGIEPVFFAGKPAEFESLERVDLRLWH